MVEKTPEIRENDRKYSEEYETAYERAYRHGITTMPTIEEARIIDEITRAEMAKMISVYAKKFRGKTEDTSKQACTQFTDMHETNEELQ